MKLKNQENSKTVQKANFSKKKYKAICFFPKIRGLPPYFRLFFEYFCFLLKIQVFFSFEFSSFLSFMACSVKKKLNAKSCVLSPASKFEKHKTKTETKTKTATCRVQPQLQSAELTRAPKG